MLHATLVLMREIGAVAADRDDDIATAVARNGLQLVVRRERGHVAARDGLVERADLMEQELTEDLGEEARIGSLEIRLLPWGDSAAGAGAVHRWITAAATAAAPTTAAAAAGDEAQGKTQKNAVYVPHVRP